MRPANAERGPGLVLRQLLSFGASIILIAGVVSLALTPWLELSWWKIFRRCVSVSSLVTLWVFLRLVHRQPVSWIGLIPWKQGKLSVLRGLGLSMAAVGLIGTLYLATSLWRIQIHPDHVRVWRVVLVSIPAMVLVGFLEEAIFRGYLLRQLLTVSRTVAIHVTSLLYAIVHIRSAWEWPHTFMELVGLYLLGCLLAFTALRTGDLYTSVGLHAGFAYAARVNKLLVELSDPGWTWLCGTSRLINGIGSWVILGVLAVLIARSQASRSQGSPA